MSTSEDQSSSVQEPESTAKLDLTKYRTGELAEGLTELISVPKAFWRLGKATVLGGLFVVIACVLIFWYAQITLIPWLLICGYALLVGALLGLLLGVLRVIAAAMKNTGSVLAIVFEITGKAATDYEQLQTGQMRLPSGGELVEQVYEEVVLPVIEKSVASAFGLLGTPLLWAYRWTIGPSVRYVVKRVQRKQMSDEEERETEEQVTSGMASIAAYSDGIQAFTASASKIITKSSRVMRVCVMVPMYALFVVALLLATIPILVVRFFVAG